MQKNNKISNSQDDQIFQQEYVENLVNEIRQDFIKRQEKRKEIERQWELNMNFLAGNQYRYVNGRGEIADESKEYFWQNRGVFNHIAPIIDSRLSKFAQISPTVSVRPKSDDDAEVSASQVAEKVIESAFKRAGVQKVVNSVTAWSETCGSGFYKIVWNAQGGNQIGEIDGEKVFEGDVLVVPVSPFEIFPDNLYNEDIQACDSIIHAKAMSVSQIYEKYGVSVRPEKIGVFSLKSSESSTIKQSSDEEVSENSAIVIERYEKPNKNLPFGRLITVCQDKLLYVGDLPYVNGEYGERTFPFVKQDSLSISGSFFGISVIERLIPIQRALNAVKNRKHEFLNRLSMGVMTVEDGSLDVEDLQDDGLSPGKVLVYRQGAKAPEFMNEMQMPDDFNTEEERLINEFVIISGVSDVTSSSSNASLSSGTALQILIQQDNSRLMMTAEEIRRSYLEIAKQTIRLFSQFTNGVRAVGYMDKYNKSKVVYADQRALNSDDVYLENENELLYTNTQKKEMLFKLYSSGLLSDDKGVIRQNVKEKVLSLLGYKELDYQNGLAHLQQERAQEENLSLRKELKPIDEIDDDNIHVDEHTRFVVSEYLELSDTQKQNFYNHIKEHKQRILSQNQN